MTKVNIATHLNRTFTAAVRARLEEDPSVSDPRDYLGRARDVLAAEVTRLLRVLTTGGVPDEAG
jgi:fructose-bisphosphate aldolase class II